MDTNRPVFLKIPLSTFCQATPLQLPSTSVGISEDGNDNDDHNDHSNLSELTQDEEDDVVAMSIDPDVSVPTILLPSLQALKRTVATNAPPALNFPKPSSLSSLNSFGLCYKDEEGDLVELCSDEALHEALMTSHATTMTTKTLPTPATKLQGDGKRGGLPLKLEMVLYSSHNTISYCSSSDVATATIERETSSNVVVKLLQDLQEKTVTSQTASNQTLATLLADVAEVRTSLSQLATDVHILKNHLEHEQLQAFDNVMHQQLQQRKHQPNKPHNHDDPSIATADHNNTTEAAATLTNSFPATTSAVTKIQYLLEAARSQTRSSRSKMSPNRRRSNDNNSATTSTTTTTTILGRRPDSDSLQMEVAILKEILKRERDQRRGKSVSSWSTSSSSTTSHPPRRSPLWMLRFLNGLRPKPSTSNNNNNNSNNSANMETSTGETGPSVQVALASQ